eukprot:TRINITY_DN15898_c0_g1_i1.p2 TRINITY_DN15898_c0_g1~~TRINITY_DN15898_c0_g1_i1.p2  ORF type:complete len:249 (+),score=44.07 TRINITY_DN15898_c0_g1_i1:59-805(+)
MRHGGLVGDPEMLLSRSRESPAGSRTIEDVLGSAAASHASRLVQAASRGETEVLRELLDSMPSLDANTQGTQGRLALHAAVYGGYLETVAALLRHRADVNLVEQGTGSLPLQLAAWEGHTEVAELLLKHRASVNKPDGRGWTPLVSAAKKGHDRMVDVLLRWRADPSLAAVVPSEPQGKLTAEQAAMSVRAKRVVEILQAARKRQENSLARRLGRKCRCPNSCLQGSLCAPIDRFGWCCESLGMKCIG